MTDIEWDKLSNEIYWIREKQDVLSKYVVLKAALKELMHSDTWY